MARTIVVVSLSWHYEEPRDVGTSTARGVITTAIPSLSKGARPRIAGLWATPKSLIGTN
jgi:hypothetical protein